MQRVTGDTNADQRGIMFDKHAQVNVGVVVIFNINPGRMALNKSRLDIRFDLRGGIIAPANKICRDRKTRRRRQRS